MSATVLDLCRFRQRGTDLARRLVPSAPVSDANWVHDHIRDQLKTRCDTNRIDQALAHADRRLRQGIRPDEAIRRAIAWATCADPDRDPPTPPLAA